MAQVVLRRWAMVAMMILLNLLRVVPCIAATADAVATGKGQFRFQTPETEDQFIQMRLDRGSLVVDDFKCYVNDRLFNVAGKSFPLTPPALIHVHGDRVPLLAPTSKPQLQKRIPPSCLAGGAGGPIVVGIGIPSSLRLSTESGKPLKLDADYMVDDTWLAISRDPASSIAEGTIAVADYDQKSSRVDTLIVDGAGALAMMSGKPSAHAPSPLVLSEGQVPLANILITSTGKVEVVPTLRRTFSAVQAKQKAINRAAMAPIVAKLKLAQPVKIVFWGDSITAGFSTSSKEFAFPNLVEAGLRKRFPNASLQCINVGVSGSDTNRRLKTFDAEVLSLKPDLIVVEFVNDMALNEDKAKDNYKQVLDQAQAAGATVLLCTPHLPDAGYYHVSTPEAVNKQPLLETIRQIAQERKVALADVANRWTDLSHEGYSTGMLMADGVLHPNDLGHRVYSEEILKDFE